jgi:uncharacterized membrane protein YdbT with pleckstrin-like domain
MRTTHHPENAMGYIEQSLGASEVLIARARFQWLYHAVAAMALLVALAAAVFPFGNYRSLLLASTAVVAGLIVSSAIMIPIWSTEIGVTNQRLIVKRGLLARRTDEIGLWAIEEANLDQSILGRLLGFGRINVQGTGDDAMSIPAIADPLRFRKAIEDAIGHATRPPGSGLAGGRNGSRPV